MSASRRIVFGLTGGSPHYLHSKDFFCPRSYFCLAHTVRNCSIRLRSLNIATMPRNQRRGCPRDQRWADKSNMQYSSMEGAANRIGSLSLTEGSGKNHPMSNACLASSNIQSQAPHQTSKAVWKPKSYGTVSGIPAVDVETIKQSSNATTAPQNSGAQLSKLFKGQQLENFMVDNKTFSLAQIRATFYPKFENEKSDQEVRTRMIEMVSRGLATLEVSLKHSGSLFMYAGHNGGAYAKNSYGNIYTAVGVYVLARTFREAWGSQAFVKQRDFNDFLERNRVCISMELVTAVLGDHGQRPREDYVVVTAVTELGEGKPNFYSTPEIIAFCRKWRLPTNHVWLFSTRKSVSSFFAAYDALCEEGTATPVCKALDEVADISVPGSKDHIKVQGEILEGLVARIVNRDSSEHMLNVLKETSPPPSNKGDLYLGPNLREICAANRSDEKQQIRAVLENVGTSFCPNYVDWFGSEGSASQSKSVDRSVLSKFLQAHPTDFSTTKLQEMIRLMREKRFPAAFKCYYNFHKMESLSRDNVDFRMVVHVHSDSAFRRYQKEMRYKPGLWPLYRGFFVDINLFKTSKEEASESLKSSNKNNINFSGGTVGKNGLADEDANLMIKLKFLTYKLRTFLIRNGLSILFKDGPGAYKAYYLRQMKIWSTSASKQRELSKMLDEWAVYIRRRCGHRQLSSSVYLSEAEPFLEQYAKRSAENQALIGAAGNFVKAEDFLALVDSGRDEEGDLEPERDFQSPTQTTPVKDVVSKVDGLIVFFPGIPGCAKSALCKEILSASGYLGDDRLVFSLMGDLIKGRYWQKVADERRKKPYSILLADKNAPNEEVWRQIEEMSRSTKASAVPVIPDSEGSVSNPFSLDALAVFMFRVLQRVNHPGNLDEASPNAGYVLLMFYHLYEGKNRKEFESELVERFGSLIKMPLLKADREPIPSSVKSPVEEGINLYNLHTRRHGRMDSTKGSYASDWVKWEKKLRDALFSNSDYLNSIQVPFESVVKQVLEQLRVVAKGEYTTSSSTKRKFGNIVFAAVDLPVADVRSVMANLAMKNKGVETFMQDKQLETNLAKAHLTLAHKRSHGVTAVANYGQFLHRNIPVELTALLYSDKTAAFEATLGSVDGENISSRNEWPHITIWTATGVAPKEANLLPQLLSAGKATRVGLDPPQRLEGTVEFY